MDMSAIIAMVFPLTLIAGAVSDLFRHEIPNSLSLSLLLGYVAYAIAAGIGLESAIQGLMCGLVVLVAGLVLFRFRFLGGGDVKLLAAASPWIGWMGLPAFLIWTALWGGLVAMMILIGRGWAERTSIGGPQWWQRLLASGEGVPYGIAICAGGLMSWTGIISSSGLY